MADITLAFLDSEGLETLTQNIKDHFVATEDGYSLMSEAEHDHLSDLETPVDSLTSESTTAPLSANQGKTLSEMITTLETNVGTAIAEAIGDITSFDAIFTDILPATGVKGTLYFIPDGDDPLSHIEYMWNDTTETWEEIGRPHIDLTNYVRLDNLVPISNAAIDALFDD